MACYIEIDKLGSPIGKQDQFACSLGGFNTIKFNKDGTVSCFKLDESLKDFLNESSLLYFTGIVRNSNNVLREQGKDESLINKISNITDKAILAFDRFDFGSVCELINNSWMIKRSLSKSVSNIDIDNLFERGIELGAVGGKLLGAGGGGFVYFIVKSNEKDFVRRGMSRDYQELKFKFVNHGTRIVFNIQGE